MADPLRKIKAGEKFQPSARAYNAMVDAALWVQQQKNHTGGQSPSINIPPGCVLVKASVDIERFQPVGIGAPLYDANSGTPNLFDYWRNNDPVFAGAAVASSDENTYGIAQEPIKSGSIGVVMVRGMTRAKVNVYSTTFKDWATIKPSTSYSKLFALDYGTSRIIQIESGTGDKWALVDLHSERSQIVGGVLTANLSPGGSSTIGLYKNYATISSDTATIIDEWQILTATVPSGSVVYGTYDPSRQHVIFEGPLPTFQIQCGKTNATFSPLGTCSCSIWTPNSSGGLLSDTGADATVVDIGGITTALPTNTVVYWATLAGIPVLLGFIGGTSIPWGCVYCLNSTGSTISAWTPVTVGDPTATIDPTDIPGMALFTSGSRVYAMTAYADAQQNRFGVTQQDIANGATGLVRIRGLSPIYVNVTDATHQYVTIASGAWKSGTFGPCMIRKTVSGTGSQWIVIDVHSERKALIGGTLAGNLARGGTATVNLYKDCESSTSETVTILDKWCMLPAAGLTSSPTQWVFGEYDFDIQKAILLGYRCP